jgi:hypothetical protein
MFRESLSTSASRQLVDDVQISMVLPVALASSW